MKNYGGGGGDPLEDTCTCVPTDPRGQKNGGIYHRHPLGIYAQVFFNADNPKPISPGWQNECMYYKLGVISFISCLFPPKLFMQKI